MHVIVLICCLDHRKCTKYETCANLKFAQVSYFVQFTWLYLFSFTAQMFHDKECVIENYFSYFSTKTLVVGTQMDRLEMVLLSTKNK